MAVKTLLRKLKAASDGVETMKGPFEELSSALDADKLRLWTKEAERADNERGEALEIYNVQMEKGQLLFFSKVPLLIILPPSHSSNIGRDETHTLKCQCVNL
jgi:hypothetical protein